jgi:hypothetical protein
MPINLVRVIHQQTFQGSILLDKIDVSQGNFTGYARNVKQKIYVPFKNPVDPTVKGYTDLIPTDEVLLASLAKGTIGGLAGAGRVTTAIVSSTLTATPNITASVHGAPNTITGTTFFSVAPDITYIILTNNITNATQKIPSSSFSAFLTTSISFLNAVVSIGTPAAGWLVQVQANSKLSNVFTMT